MRGLLEERDSVHLSSEDPPQTSIDLWTLCSTVGHTSVVSVALLASSILEYTRVWQCYRQFLPKLANKEDANFYPNILIGVTPCQKSSIAQIGHQL